MNIGCDYNQVQGGALLILRGGATAGSLGRLGYEDLIIGPIFGPMKIVPGLEDHCLPKITFRDPITKARILGQPE